MNPEIELSAEEVRLIRLLLLDHMTVCEKDRPAYRRLSYDECADLDYRLGRLYVTLGHGPTKQALEGRAK